jgi:putative endonuclease
MPSKKRLKGNTGEKIANYYLQNKGFNIIYRNYLKPWGEIDIVAEKDKILWFFEIKTVFTKGCGNKRWEDNRHRPEDNISEFKLHKLRKVILTFLDEFDYGLEIDFEFVVICINYNELKNVYQIKFIDNIVL